MKSLISPWESVSIDDGFGHAGFGVEEENKKVLWGPFAILDCGDEFMTQQLIQEWLQNTDEFTIDIRDISEGDQKLWQWFSNRDHRFMPEFQPIFENGILKCKTSNIKADGKTSYRNYWFRSPNETEWQRLAPGITGIEERFKYVLKTYYGWT